MPIKFLLLPLLLLTFSENIFSQDSTDLMNQLVNQTEKNKINYAENTFKYTRVVDGHSVENLPKKVLDVRISHRFDPVNSGIYNFFGLDVAVMRLGFDYGVSNNFMIGVGHSVYQKTYDGFFKWRILRQSTGAVNMPITLSFVPTVAVNTLRQFDSGKTTFSDRVSSVFQLLIARKFSETFSLQLMPTFIHADNISFNHPKQNIIAIGIAGTQKVSKRMNVNVEYYYQLPDDQAPVAPALPTESSRNAWTVCARLRNVVRCLRRSTISAPIRRSHSFASRATRSARTACECSRTPATYSKRGVRAKPPPAKCHGISAMCSPPGRVSYRKIQNANIGEGSI